MRKMTGMNLLNLLTSGRFPPPAHPLFWRIIACDRNARRQRRSKEIRCNLATAHEDEEEESSDEEDEDESEEDESEESDEDEDSAYSVEGSDEE